MENKILENQEITRISSKGQLVIPNNIRKELHIKEGDIFATSSIDNNLIILKKIKDSILKEELVMLKEIREAWKEIDSGKCKTMDEKEFFEEIKKW